MIREFRGGNFYLSNMFPVERPISTEQGFLVPTSEHAYQAAKFVDPELHRMVAHARGHWDDMRPWASGLASKIQAEKLIAEGAVMREDWEAIKVVTMLGVVRKKFQTNPGIAARLVDTGEQEIIEGNNWGDTFWGVSPIEGGEGSNELGKILMQVRAEIRSITD